MQASSIPLQRNASRFKGCGLWFSLWLLLWIGIGSNNSAISQSIYDYDWFEDTIARMPAALTNNAVIGTSVGSIFYAYSFGGIDTSKIWSGISQASFRYDPSEGFGPGSAGEWLELPPMPDTLGKIGSAASVVKDKIYIIGGYHVLEDGTEISSNRVHIFDPETNTWMPDGAPVPIPIDDQVQVVYRDSLIYVITGWSNASTVSNVQIYNPALDEWLEGTPVPNTNQYMAFGAAGVCQNNIRTISYIGGARMGLNFPIAPFVRSGVIDENDPTQITWSFYEDSLAGRYRAATASQENSDIVDLLVFGGSSKTYNYNGIAYDGTGGVSPRSLEFIVCNNNCNRLSSFPSDTFRVMDMRGVAVDPNLIADLFPRRFAIVGGMGLNQQLTGTAHVTWLLYEGLESPQQVGLSVQPTLTAGPIQVLIEDASLYGRWNYQLVDLRGRTVLQGIITPPATLDFSDRAPSIYFLVLEREGRQVGLKVTIAR